SSSEQLVNALNERARAFNPAWMIYAAAILLFIFAMGSKPDSNAAPLSTKSLAGENYPTIVARHGYPNSVVESNPLGVVTARTAFYTAAHLGLTFVQEPCISVYENATIALSEQKEDVPSLVEGW